MAWLSVAYFSRIITKSRATVAARACAVGRSTSDTTHDQRSPRPGYSPTAAAVDVVVMQKQEKLRVLVLTSATTGAAAAATAAGAGGGKNSTTLFLPLSSPPLCLKNGGSGSWIFLPLTSRFSCRQCIYCCRSRHNYGMFVVFLPLLECARLAAATGQRLMTPVFSCRAC